MPVRRRYPPVEIDKKYGQWLVLSGPTKEKHPKWACKCLTCGRVFSVGDRSLKIGESKSCGCQTTTTHNQSRTRLYRIWQHIKLRCDNPNSDNYSHYGGRGIAICDEWLDFASFSAWAHLNGYANNLTIERNDVNKDYASDNCCWIPRSEQMSNTRRTRRVTVNNETMPLTHAVRKFSKLSYMAVLLRIRAGMNIEDALFAPPYTKYSTKAPQIT